MGVAIVIKPLVFVLALAALLLLLRSGKSRKAPVFILCFLIPLAFFGLVVAGGPVWGISWGPAMSGISTAYLVPDTLMAMLNLAAAGSFATVTIVVAAAAFLCRRAGPFEEYLLIAVLLLFSAIFFKEYLHYWFLALPFAALLCASAFSDEQKVIIGASQ